MKTSSRRHALSVQTVSALYDELVLLKKKHLNLRFQKSSGQLENTAQIRHVRRDIARIKTFLAQKKS